jgi:hypothetical protein
MKLSFNRSLAPEDAEISAARFLKAQFNLIITIILLRQNGKMVKGRSRKGQEMEQPLKGKIPNLEILYPKQGPNQNLKTFLSGEKERYIKTR